MKYAAAISDADILIHILKTDNQSIIENLFERVIIPKYVLEIEVKRKHYPSYEKLQVLISDPNNAFELQDKDADREVRQIANVVIADLKDIIGPGECHATGYAAAFGCQIIISDNYTEFQWIPSEYITLTYHEILVLNVRFGYLTFQEAEAMYNTINSALDRPSTQQFATRQEKAYQRFQTKDWLNVLGI